MKKQLLNLFSLVAVWGTERNFYADNGTTAIKQFAKLTEELGELSGNIARGKDYTDDIGDYQVVLKHIATLCEISITEQMIPENTGEPIYPSDDVDVQLIYLTDITGQIGKAILHLPRTNIDSKIRLNVLIETALFTLACLAQLADTNLLHCLEHSYNEIKDRKGQMVNGVFIKESDLESTADTKPCEKCKSRTALVSGTLYYRPDAEPYENGIEEPAKVDEGECWVGAYKCDECNHVQFAWTE